MKDYVNLMEIFYLADEFCKEFYKNMAGYQIETNTGKKRRNKPCKLNDSEVITILIAFHLGGYRNLKHFYIYSFSFLLEFMGYYKNFLSMQA